MYDKEKKVRELRLLQATQRNLTGLDGKIGTVLRNLGKPILRSGSDWFQADEFDSPYNTGGDFDGKPSVDDLGFSSRPPDDLPTLDEDETSEEVGTHFSGLSWGMHLEIKYVNDEQELLVTFGGYPVYSETAGELTCYVPGDWEPMINLLFGHAKKIEEKRFQAVAVENKQESRRVAGGLLDQLKKFWGA
jgi:hypothetical protein